MARYSFYKGSYMITKKSFGSALKLIRQARKLTQEDFSEISSRTYISALERGLYTPTIEKTNEFCKVLVVNPITLTTISYLIENDMTDAAIVLDKVLKEIEALKLTNSSTFSH